MIDYSLIKLIHIGAVTLSGSLFALRGCWMLLDSAYLQQTWVRIVPHMIDTVLLLSALALIMLSGQYPFVQHWLSIKLVAVMVYIGLGMVALKPRRPKSARIAAWISAMLVFGYIVLLALTRDPLWFMR